MATEVLTPLPTVLLPHAPSNHITEAETNKFQFRTDYIRTSKNAVTKRSVRAEVASILGIPDEEDAWTIECGQDNDNLVLVSPDKKVLPKYAWLKGVALDLKHRVRVISSFPYTTVAVADKLVQDEAGKIRLTDNYKTVHTFDANKIRILPAFEGTIVNVGWYKGALIFSTGSKLDARGSYRPSKIGHGRTLWDIYEGRGGPSAEVLFDTSKQYSAFSYTFLLSAPGNRTTNKLPIGEGAVFLLAVFPNFTEKNCPYDPALCGFQRRYGPDHPSIVRGCPLPSVDLDPHGYVARAPGQIPSEPQSYVPYLPDFFDSEEAMVADLVPVYAPVPMTLAEANSFLKKGFYPNEPVPADTRLGCGESIIIEASDGRRIQVNSLRYAFQRFSRGENPSAESEFYERTDLARKGKEWFLANYPRVPMPDWILFFGAIRAGLPLLSWIGEDPENLMPVETVAERLQIIQVVHILSCPPEEQADALDYLLHFEEDQKQVVENLLKFDFSQRWPRNVLELALQARGPAGRPGQEKVRRAAVEQLVQNLEGKELYRVAKLFRPGKNTA